MKFINYILHINTWWWGKTITLVHKEGIATVEVQIDDTYPTTAFIKGLSVFTLKRKKGYGTQMLQLCEEIAKKEGKQFLQLSANKQEEWLVNWYKSLGYIIYYSDEHEYTMIKVLNKVTIMKRIKVNPNETEWLRLSGKTETIVAYFKDGSKQTMSVVDFLMLNPKKKKKIVQVDCYEKGEEVTH